MLLIFPPSAKPSEPPAGIARLSGYLQGHNIPCTLLDANIEGLLYLLQLPIKADDKWSIRASKNVEKNISALRTPNLYASADRYARAVMDINRVLDKIENKSVSLSLANYQDERLSPLNSQDLIQALNSPDDNIFYPYFSKRLPEFLEKNGSEMVGFSLNYLSQAITTFAMIGFVKRFAPELKIVLGGGLVTSWVRNPSWNNPFTGLIDHFIAGPGEKPLLNLLRQEPASAHFQPDYTGLPLDKYLSPGLTLPYAASSGCYWNKCSFCPENAEDNPYEMLPVNRVRQELASLTSLHQPSMIHLLDNAITPALMKSFAEDYLGTPWYAFARVNKELLDVNFCKNLRKSGCVLLKLGIESGDQDVLDAMDKGINIKQVSQVLNNLHEAGIATYIYLLFGTPSESLQEARHTLDFVVRHQQAITFLNLAVFNMPICSVETQGLPTKKFYNADLSLYTDFEHPRDWNRPEIRQFLDQEFKRHPAIRPIILRDPPIFTSNHAPFFNPL